MDEADISHKRRRIYTPAEVAQHNYKGSCWLIIFGEVYDFTDLICESRGPEVELLIANAGRDVSHWFDRETGDVRSHVHPEFNIPAPYLPHGRFLHVPPMDPSSDWVTDYGTPWWRDERYRIGQLAQRTRRIRIMNTLTEQECVLEVGAEETMREILDRYLDYNRHAGSYTWKALLNGDFRPLDMELTLEENGVADEAEEFAELEIDEDYYIPVVHLYFDDDLTEA